MKDFRNYKVSIQYAKLALGFTPIYTVRDIVNDLYSHQSSYGNYDQDKYYNIDIFKSLGK